MENQYEVQRSLGRIEGGIIEIKSDVALMRTDHALLRSEFNKLEAGRLTKLESAFAASQAEINAKARNIATWTSATISIGVAVLTAIILHYFKI